MVTYTYYCNACDCKFDKQYKTMMEAKAPRCPRCKSRNIERIYDAPSIKFNGPGFYVNDGGNNGKG